MKTLMALSALALAFLVARYDITAAGPRWSQAEAERRVRATARALGVPRRLRFDLTTPVLRKEAE